MFSKRGDYFPGEMSRERKKRHHGDATQLAKAASRPGCDGPTPMAGKGTGIRLLGLRSRIRDHPSHVYVGGKTRSQNQRVLPTHIAQKVSTLSRGLRAQPPTSLGLITHQRHSKLRPSRRRQRRAA